MKPEEPNLWEQITTGMRSNITPANGLVVGGIILFALLVTFVAFAYWRNSPETRARRLRRAKFDEVGNASGLSSPECRILWKVARAEGLEDPLEIYFRRSVFEARVGGSSASPDQVSEMRSKLYFP